MPFLSFIKASRALFWGTCWGWTCGRRFIKDLEWSLFWLLPAGEKYVVRNTSNLEGQGIRSWPHKMLPGVLVLLTGVSKVFSQSLMDTINLRPGAISKLQSITSLPFGCPVSQSALRWLSVIFPSCVFWRPGMTRCVPDFLLYKVPLCLCTCDICLTSENY